MNIYLIRHGRQDSALCNVNVSLSEEGKRQAELTGERLLKYNIEAVYSSDLIRAVETADIINKYILKERVIDERLREIDYGLLTGLSNSQLKSEHGDFLDKRAKMEEDMCYPGGECSREVFERAFEVIKEISSKNYENVAVVTHGGVIRALMCGIIGAPFSKTLVVGRQIENCSISEILYDRQMNTFHIERINDYAHFEDIDELRRKHFTTGFFSKKQNV